MEDNAAQKISNPDKALIEAIFRVALGDFSTGPVDNLCEFFCVISEYVHDY
jgi:hypothetical protein